jgi:transposase
MPLREQLSDAFGHIQGHLFPWLRSEIGPLTNEHERIVVVLGMVRVEAFVSMRGGGPGRPQDDRHALTRAFVSKAVLGLPETRMLIDRLRVDTTLRRLCGWQRVAELPSESTFSRAFAELAEGGLPTHMHKALVERTLGQQLVGHLSIDATAIEAREKQVRIEAPKPAKVPAKRGRRKKGEAPPPKRPRRLERQMTMTVPEMLADLPVHCGYGAKRNAKGHTASWIGYKLHIATADGDIPVACVLTSASVHDSQVAIPLMKTAATRVTSLYDLMDSAYYHPEIEATSRSLGHVPIIEPQPRSGQKVALQTEARAKRRAGYQLAEDVRYNQRSSAERVNAMLKDNCGGKHVRVRGAAKVMCHLMLAILVVTVEQLMRLIV